MPKIIENLRHKLIREAGRQAEEAGYSAMTVRSVAQACGVGVGTVYNYFPSKDAMLASYMLEDWQGCMSAISAVSAGADAPIPVVQCIWDQLRQYSARHQTVFRDESAAASFSGAFSRYHSVLRGQLAEPLRKFCADAFTAEFIAESLLVWTMDGKGLDEICGVIGKLFD